MSDQVGQENKPGTNEGENAKGATSTGTDSIKIKVRDEMGTEVLFKVKMSTQMRKIKEKYCEKASKNVSNIRFLFDGETISDDTTPKELQMEAEDIIEVVSSQTGGRHTPRY
ncbi:small ubiquitin-related modifier 1-B-like [Acanthaster planci]|uniref:Small ubiquitin-related modifier n=1 Tax=Acanthaster planci TaxID=133434 RepID=A0A8B7YVN4_ACAPL|nr:small ubiquitin-related modifier 1-B-like [Acanthaster planci]